MILTFKRSTRQGIKPLIGLTGESNSGKTFSALLLARGIAGPNGRIGLVDTESGRGALYSDQVPGGYDRADFEPDFSPQRYIAALDECESAGLDVIVFDSFSHEWEGQGGVVEMAGAEEERTGKNGLHCWKNPKQQHKQLMLRLQRSKSTIILCLRAMHKTRQVVNQQTGKKEIVKDDHLTPIQSEGFMFDLTVILEMRREDPGTFWLRKWSEQRLGACFPLGDDGVGVNKVSIAHGEAVAKWCKEVGGAAPAAAKKPNLRRELWNRVAESFGGDVKLFEASLRTSGHLTEGQTLKTAPDSLIEELLGIYTVNPAPVAATGNV